MSEKQNLKKNTKSNSSAKKGGRPKKFEGKTKPVTFRIEEKTYDQYKDKIREKINGVIDELVAEQKNNKDKYKKVTDFAKKEKPEKKEVLKDSKGTMKKPKEKEIKNEVEEDEKVFIFYEENRDEIKDKVRKIVQEQENSNEQEETKVEQKQMTEEEIYNEFKDFINEDNPEFQEYIIADKRKEEK